MKLIYDEIKKYGSEEFGDENPYKNIFLLIIYPNQFKESPFDYVMDNNLPKCIHLMLQMLVDLDGYRLSLFVKEHFNKLFTMNLEIFEQYLNAFTF